MSTGIEHDLFVQMLLAPIQTLRDMLEVCIEHHEMFEVGVV